jgi:hypothetical protein
MLVVKATDLHYLYALTENPFDYLAPVLMWVQFDLGVTRQALRRPFPI